MDKTTRKKREKKKYYIYGHGDGKLAIKYEVKNTDGSITHRIKTRSTKNRTYKQAKKELIDIACSEMSISRPNPKKIDTNKEEIKEKFKNGLEPKDVIQCERMEDIDWKELFSKSVTMTIFASSRSGKTTLLAKLYKDYLRKIHDLNVLGSGSLSAPIYKDFKKCVKLTGINEEFIKIIYTLQKKTKGKYYKVCQIYDDIDPKAKYIDILNKCFFKMRNTGHTSTILSVQDMVMVDKGVRNNSHFVMIMNTSRMDDNRQQFIFEVLQPYFRHQIGDLSSAQQKRMIINYCHEKTQHYGFIFVDTLEQKIYQCKNKIE